MSYDRRFALGLLVLLTACEPQHEPPTSPAVVPGPRTLHAVLLPVQADLDEEWAQVARGAVAGFAGYYRAEDGDIVVAVSRAEAAARARDHVRAVLEASGSPAGSIRSRVVAWGFDQLKPWKDGLTALLDDDEVYWLDIDEVQNRLVFGVRSLGVQGRLLQAAARIGVPAMALGFVVTDKPLPRASVRDQIRPVRGGVQITGSVGVCTLGFNAYWNGLNGFLTNSHCSTSDGGTDGTVQHQPTVATSNRIGVEHYDPGGTRWSDAAFYLYDSGIDRDYGHIARTLFPAINQDGSLIIDPSYPRFRITSKAANSVQLVGELVNKVGRTTGWTQGQVSQTCVTLSNHPCQWVALVWSWRGDSGSPIFRQNGASEPDASRVALWGILWGGPPNDSSVTWYSPVNGVEQDLGTLVVTCDPGAVVCKPPPPAVTIVGPSEVQQHVSCTWSSHVSGGAKPYSYEWRRDNQIVSTGSSYTTQDSGSSSFLLELYVTDALASVSFAYLQVTVQGSGQIVCA